MSHNKTAQSPKCISSSCLVNCNTIVLWITHYCSFFLCVNCFVQLTEIIYCISSVRCSFLDVFLVCYHWDREDMFTWDSPPKYYTPALFTTFLLGMTKWPCKLAHLYYCHTFLFLLLVTCNIGQIMIKLCFQTAAPCWYITWTALL